MIIGGSVAVVDADVAVVVSWTSRTRQVAVNAINLTNQVPPDDILLTPKKPAALWKLFYGHHYVAGRLSRA